MPGRRGPGTPQASRSLSQHLGQKCCRGEWAVLRAAWPPRSARLLPLPTQLRLSRAPLPAEPSARRRRDARPGPGAERPGAPRLPAVQHAAGHQDVRGGRHHRPSEAAEEGTCLPPGTPAGGRLPLQGQGVRVRSGPGRASARDGSSVAPGFSRAAPSWRLFSETYSLAVPPGEFQARRDLSALSSRDAVPGPGGGRQRPPVLLRPGGSRRRSEIRVGWGGDGEIGPGRFQWKFPARRPGH